jgi:hypothetical protein
MKAAQGGHVEAMYHLATFPDFTSEPFRSPLSEEETWQWLLLAAEKHLKNALDLGTAADTRPGTSRTRSNFKGTSRTSPSLFCSIRSLRSAPVKLGRREHRQAVGLSRNGSARLMIHAHDQ